MLDNKWFVVPKPNPHADLRLICFPYAGGSATIYMSWVKYLPKNVELVIVQPPGRGARMFEQAFSTMASLTAELLKVFPKYTNKPYILFGHSLGSRIAFELMNQLQTSSLPLPQIFIASGSRAPHIASTKKTIHHLPDDAFIAELKHLNGTPQAVIENKELMALFLPLLRADFEIADNYCFADKAVFNCPIYVLSGKDDVDITQFHLESWGDFFNSTANMHMISGNHFFIESHKVSVLQKVNDIIATVLDKTTSRFSPHQKLSTNK
ncbi:MAG: medium-chain acyl-[acyl-carrier-protein] hydrolase [Francisellaceae bacterium]|jgi:medium-chain acyl-[acyl-carrier-protein] hydrolase